jgi:hypothetical protein
MTEILKAYPAVDFYRSFDIVVFNTKLNLREEKTSSEECQSSVFDLDDSARFGETLGVP